MERAHRLLEAPRRCLLGITGPPGVGKSTLAAHLVAAIGPLAVVVPMDGFHLADTTLDRLGRRAWKGCIDTFDGHGYAALLRRLRTESDHDVYAPMFERDLEQPLAGAITVTTQARLVITDGNYLLDDTPPWSGVAELLDEVWYCEPADDDMRRQRLLERHIRFGKTPRAADEWTARVDEPNADRIATGRARASLTVSL